MTSWLKQLDELLRGDRTRTEVLSTGLIPVPLRVFVPLAAILGAAYGFFMGWFALAGGGEGWKQLLAGMVKLPGLFLLTLIVTFPSLYVFNALVGSRLNFISTLRLLVAAIVVNLALGASLGPILAFFTLSTTSYHFIVLLNVVILGIAGAISLGFLIRTLRKLSIEEGIPPLPGQESSPPVGRIFRIWVLIYALVGLQMGWLLRPFVGAPGAEFVWFRARESNVFLSLVQIIQHLFGIKG